MNHTITITNPAESELESVLRFAFQHLVPNELTLRIGMMMQQYYSGQLDTTGIFQVHAGKTLAGALYSQCRPDGSVMLWVPAVIEIESLELLMEHLRQFCCQHNAFAAIALADRNQPFDEQSFCAAGQFQYLSDLIHLVVELSCQEPTDQPQRLQFVSLKNYSPEVSDYLTKLVKRTYQSSFDFPDLMRIAPVESVLCGYQSAAVFQPELWFIVQCNGNDVGVLLLTDIGSDQFELTYMGLIESARRQGLSREIVRFAKATACRWNRTLLLTAVDSNNTPACQSYLAEGFKAWDRKKVFARFFQKQ